ncbi:hypothetical protein ENUP19_0146G0069 [Entamoeba nuttalli]|uniref:DDE-1 domain-containing protein n=2 Tax=Entamoeba nuttalli TaxID=412467 RepID=K2HA99_ENTNP|nr:hypothetical protein ENU1_125130 [Entamoeba nuttalli P19]EKE39509.1 hypothetical protein ENU1_125130 [Entamoeba nuttalli P19]|eukprot:XP_008858156.1 hypothetical protein ENU1_125130 [Entamoeba nuttalli P19]
MSKDRTKIPDRQFLKNHIKFNRHIQDMLERNIAITENTLTTYCREVHNKQPTQINEVFSGIGLELHKLKCVLVQSSDEYIKEIQNQIEVLIKPIRKEFVYCCDTFGFQLYEGKQIECYSKYDGGDVFIDRESRLSNGIIGLSPDGDIIYPFIVLNKTECAKKSTYNEMEKKCIFSFNLMLSIKCTDIQKWCIESLVPQINEKKKKLNYNGRALIIINHFVFKLMKNIEHQLDKAGIDVFVLPKDYGDENEPIYKTIELCVNQLNNKSFSFLKKIHIMEYLQFLIKNGRLIKEQFNLAYRCNYTGDLIEINQELQKEINEIELKKVKNERKSLQKKEIKEQNEEDIRKKSDNVIVTKDTPDDSIKEKLKHKNDIIATVNNFVNELVKVIEGVPLSLIICCDVYEPPNLKKSSGWTTRSGRMRKSEEIKEMKASVILCINGDGKGARPLCCVKEIVKKQMTLLFNDKVYFKDTSDGYINEECFLLWLFDEVIPFATEQRKKTGNEEQRIVLLINEELKNWINEEQMKQYLIKIVFVPKKLKEATMPLQQVFDCIDEEVINYVDLKESVCFTTLDTYFETFEENEEQNTLKIHEMFKDFNYTELLLLGDQEEIESMKKRIINSIFLFETPIIIDIPHNIDAITSFDFDKTDLNIREKRVLYRTLIEPKFKDIKNASLQLYFLHLKFPRLVSHLFPFFNDLTHQKRSLKRLLDD